jgi:hypothetical protein
MTVYNDPSVSGAAPPRPTSPALIAAAWLVVCVPAAWGVYETIRKSIPLFHPPAAHAATAPTTAPAR